MYVTLETLPYNIVYYKIRTLQLERILRRKAIQTNYSVLRHFFSKLFENIFRSHSGTCTYAVFSKLDFDGILAKTPNFRETAATYKSFYLTRLCFVAINLFLVLEWTKLSKNNTMEMLLQIKYDLLVQIFGKTFCVVIPVHDAI